MAILSGVEVKGFEFVQYGRPFVKFEVNSIAATTVGSNRYVNMDGFFVGASGVATQIVTNNIYVKRPTVGWVNVQEAYINVSGTWKRITNDKMYVKAPSGQWRT